MILLKIQKNKKIIIVHKKTLKINRYKAKIKIIKVYKGRNNLLCMQKELVEKRKLNSNDFLIIYLLKLNE